MFSGFGLTLVILLVTYRRGRLVQEQQAIWDLWLTVGPGLRKEQAR